MSAIKRHLQRLAELDQFNIPVVGLFNNYWIICELMIGDKNVALRKNNHIPLVELADLPAQPMRNPLLSKLLHSPFKLRDDSNAH
jgi:hypothetical protein